MNFADQLKENPVFDLVSRAAQQQQVPAFVVGGFVRDLILKRPSKDIDIVCLGSGIQLAAQVAKLIGDHAHLAVYKNFGTAQVKYNDWEIEFVGARKESYRAESRKPIVEDGTLEDDQNRRDFTINAMAISLQPSDFGMLIDPFNGVGDLEQKIIRTPLDPIITFSDDPLRMMRAVRFAAQLGFDIDHLSFEAIQSQAERIKIVSAERITDEFNKIILTQKPSYGFKLLLHANLLDLIFPEFVLLKGAAFMEGVGHKDNFYHTLQVLDNISVMTTDLWLRWAAILHDIAKPLTKRFDKRVGWTFHNHEEKGARMVKPLFTRFKLPLNEHMKLVEKLVRMHLRPIALSKEEITDSAVRRLIFDAGEDIDSLMMLCRADITSKNMQKVRRYLTNFDLLEKRIAEVEERDRVRNFQPVIHGELIMHTFELAPCKAVGDIKTAVREAILDGKIRNILEEAWPFMMETALQLGIKPVHTDMHKWANSNQ